MLTNPLIIATVAVLLVKASGLTVPQTATTFLAHLGNDSLAMGLLCIGAGLRLHDFRDHLALITTSVVCRLLSVPAIAWGAVTLAGLDARVGASRMMPKSSLRRFPPHRAAT